MKRVWRQMRKSDETGLTLIEVLIVVFIISIILAIVIPSYADSTKKAQEKLCFASQRMIEAQIELYQIDKMKDYPIDATDMFKTLRVDGYIKENPVCPAGGKYTLENGLLKCDKHGHYQNPASSTGSSS